MQRIMIVSDTHRKHGNLAEALYREGALISLFISEILRGRMS